MIDYIHGCTTVVRWERCRYQSVCVGQVVCAIRCHFGTQFILVGNGRCDAVIITRFQDRVAGMAAGCSGLVIWCRVVCCHRIDGGGY